MDGGDRRVTGRRERRSGEAKGRARAELSIGGEICEGKFWKGNRETRAKERAMLPAIKRGFGSGHRPVTAERRSGGAWGPLRCTGGNE